MRRAKGIVFLIVLAMMVFGLVTVANAATFSDVAGTKYSTAVDALSALKIVDGYPDGTIKPDQTITRAEFAKIIDLELGYGAAVAKSSTQFSDVPDSHWASGYINVAVGQGILKGYPDGTFKPDANVSYAEAITMLVRMLGFQPSMDETTWPASYLAKASQLGLTSGVSINASAEAKRGDVFMMAFNSLDANTMHQTAWGTDNEWTETDDFDYSIMNKYLNLDRVGNKNFPVTVAATKVMDTSLDKDGMRVKAVYTKDPGDDDEESGQELLTGGDTKEYDFVEGLDVSKYLGQETELWLNDEDEVVFIKCFTDSDKVFSDVVDEFDAADETITLKAKDKEYTVDDDAVIYYQGTEYTTAAFFAATESRGDYGAQLPIFGRGVKVVVKDNGKIGYIEGWKGNAGLVISVDAEDETIKYYMDSDSKTTLDLSDNDKDYIVYRDGKLATLADIKEGDLILGYPNMADDDNVRMIKASSTVVSGKVEKATDKGAGFVDDYYLTIDGKQYPVAGNVDEDEYGIDAMQTVSFDDNETIDPIEVDDFDDMVGQDVKVYLWGGNVRHVEAGSKAASNDIFGIAKSADTDLSDLSMKVLKGNGDTVTYEGTDDTKWTIDTGAPLANIDEVKWDDLTGAQQTALVNEMDTNAWLLKINLTSDGKLKTVECLWDAANGAVDTLTPDQDDLRIAIGASNEVISDDASYFDVNDPDSPDDSTWTNIQDTADSNGNTLDGYAYVDPDTDEVRAVVITEMPVVSQMYYGIITSKSKIVDEYSVDMIVEGENKSYETDDVSVTSFIYGNNGASGGNTMSKIQIGDIIGYTTNGSGDIDEITELYMTQSDGTGNATENYVITDINSSRKTLTVKPVSGGSEVEVFLSTKTDSDEKCYVFDYSGDDPEFIELGDLSEDDEVQLFFFDPAVKPDLDGKVQFVKKVD